MRRFLPILIALVVAGIVVARVDANDIPPVPQAPCTLAQRLNIHIEDGWLYECSCSVLATGFHCEWNLVGQVAQSSAIRRRRQHRRLIPVLVIRNVVA